MEVSSSPLTCGMPGKAEREGADSALPSAQRSRPDYRQRTQRHSGPFETYEIHIEAMRDVFPDSLSHCLPLVLHLAVAL